MSLILSGSEGLSDVDGTAATPAIRGTDTNTGIFFPAADTIAFAEGGVESMRLDSSGNVGIGTSSPATRLQVNGQTRVSDGTTNIDIVCASATGFIGTQTNAPLVLRTNDIERARIASNGDLTLRTGGSSTTTHIFGFNEGGGEFNLCDNTGTGGTLIDLAFGSTRLLHVLSTGNQVLGIGSGNTTGVIQFMRAGFVEAARIDSSGNLLVGTTSVPSPGGVSGQGLIVNNSSNNGAWSVFQSTGASSNRGIAVSYTGASPNDGFNEAYFFRDSTATRFLVKSNGGINNYSANNTNLSDRREKTNFAPAGEYLSKICAIPVQTFNYADQNLEQDPGLTLGVVAQDVQAVAPELVMESNWGTEEEPKMRLSIYQTDLQYALMKCIQEQQAIIDAQQAALNQLKADVAALKGTA